MDFEEWWASWDACQCKGADRARVSAANAMMAASRRYRDLLVQAVALNNALLYLYESNKSQFGLDEFQIEEDSSSLGGAKKVLREFQSRNDLTTDPIK